MRIIFVGVHNKPGLKPLDSASLSGKTIDQVIARLTEFECVKTNLFDVDYMPLPDEIQELKMDFYDRVNISHDDVVVLLGGIVQKHLGNELACTVIKAAHPSLQFAKVKRPDYVKRLYEQILFAFVQF